MYLQTFTKFMPKQYRYHYSVVKQLNRISRHCVCVSIFDILLVDNYSLQRNFKIDLSVMLYDIKLVVCFVWTRFIWYFTVRSAGRSISMARCPVDHFTFDSINDSMAIPLAHLLIYVCIHVHIYVRTYASSESKLI